MTDAMKELDKTLGILSDVDKIKDEPWNYVHNKPFKTPAQDLVDIGQVPPQEDLGDLNDAETDYEYQRKQFYNLVEKGTNAIDGILEIAKEGEHPRGYEVAGNLIKQVAEVTEKLGDLQEKMKKLKEVPDSAPKNVTNALFVGSTAELQNMLKDK